MIDSPMPQQFTYAGGTKLTPQFEETVLNNPSTGEKIGHLAYSSDTHIEAAIQNASDLWNDHAWQSIPAIERAPILEKIGHSLLERTEELAVIESRSTGITIETSRLLSLLTGKIFITAADEARRHKTTTELNGQYGPVEVHRAPWGPVACLGPWNAPAPIGAHKIALAIAAGCPVIFKPSEWTPFSAMLLAETISTSNLPQGAFQLILGGPKQGAKLVKDPRIKAVSFTGGVKGGRAIGNACSEQFKPAQLELGGNNPMIVFSDANPEKAAEGIVQALTGLNGQWCRALGRLIIHQDIKHSVLEKVESILAGLKIGDALDPASQMGPMIHKHHRAQLQSSIDKLVEKGGTLIQPSIIPDEGSFMAPCLIDNAESEDSLEEIFGPVATIHSFSNEDEAWQLASATPYGLAAYVYTANINFGRQFSRKLSTGSVKINGVSMTSLHPDAPRSAWGWSGMGEEGTKETFRFFCGTKVIGIADEHISV